MDCAWSNNATELEEAETHAKVVQVVIPTSGGTVCFGNYSVSYDSQSNFTFTIVAIIFNTGLFLEFNYDSLGMKLVTSKPEFSLQILGQVAHDRI